jgi:hypothetical protein
MVGGGVRRGPAGISGPVVVETAQGGGVRQQPGKPRRLWSGLGRVHWFNERQGGTRKKTPYPVQ